MIIKQIVAGASCAALAFVNAACLHQSRTVANDLEATPAPVVSLQEQRQIRRDYNARTGSFNLKDTNGDDHIDVEEWIAFKGAFWFDYDLNSDNKLSWPEFASAWCPLPRNSTFDDVARRTCLVYERQSFVAMERSGDGLLSRDEVRPLAREGFDYVDFCKDGLLTEMEASGRAREAARNKQQACPASRS